MGADSGTFFGMLIQSSLRNRVIAGCLLVMVNVRAALGVDYSRYAVAADHEVASKAGAEILAAGGNAVDAAVATSFALSVARPFSCGIGGGGFMLIHLVEDPAQPGRPLNIAINYREQAAACMKPDYFEKLDAKANSDADTSTHGGHAVGIPGTVAGLLYALERYGTMPREKVLAPAIRAAREGFVADAAFVAACKDAVEWIGKHPGAEKRFDLVWNVYAAHGNRKVGDVVKSLEQARTLEIIAKEGASAFYQGEIGKAIVAAITRDGGAMTMDDLASFRVATDAPLVTSFGGKTLLCFPPPSSGGIVLTQVFATLEQRPDLIARSREAGHNSATYLHLLAESSKHAFADRAHFLGDPAKVGLPMKSLLDPAMLRARAARIDPLHTAAHDTYGMPAPKIDRPVPEDHGTSHLSVVDERGNAVACTETVNLLFGSLLDVTGYGFVLNNQMDDFLTRRGKVNAFGLAQDDRNLPSPGKRPLSSMSPTIGLDGTAENAASKVVLVVGGSGGPRIISATMQSALNVLLWDMGAEAAVASPRMHHQWTPDSLELESSLRGGEVEKTLEAYGHVIAQRSAAAVQLIRASKAPGMRWDAASDPRKGGRPAGN